MLYISPKERIINPYLENTNKAIIFFVFEALLVFCVIASYTKLPSQPDRRGRCRR